MAEKLNSLIRELKDLQREHSRLADRIESLDERINELKITPAEPPKKGKDEKKGAPDDELE